MEWLGEKRDVSSVMRTCRALHSGGVLVLLQRTIEIGHGKELKKFHIFLQSKIGGTSDRFLLLRDLQIHSNIKKGWRVAVMTEILSRAIHLQSILLSHTERFMELHSETHGSAIELPRLTRAVLLDAGPATVDWLSRTYSPISNLTIRAVDDRTPLNLIQAISNFGATLIELDACHVYIESSGPQFHLLRTLTIRSTIVIPSAWIFRTFPRLQCLNMSCLLGMIPDDDEVHSDHTAHMALLSRTGQPLPSLKVLSGLALDLYRSSCACPTETLDCCTVNVVDLPWIPGLLQITRPTILKMHVHGDAFEDAAIPLIELALRSASVTTTLNELWIEVECRGRPSELVIELVVCFMCFGAMTSSLNDLWIRENFLILRDNSPSSCLQSF